MISGINQVKIAELSLTKPTDALRGFDGVSKEVKQKMNLVGLSL